MLRFRKAQISIEFIAGFVLFMFVIMYIAFSVVNNAPMYYQNTMQNNLRAEAWSFSERVKNSIEIEDFVLNKSAVSQLSKCTAYNPKDAASVGNYSYWRTLTAIPTRRDFHISLTEYPVVADNPLPNMVGWWRFNEGSGKNVTDSSYYGNNGNISGADWTTNATSGYALIFKGGDNVSVPHSNSLNTPNITVETWIRPANLTITAGADVVFVAKGTTGTGKSWMLHSRGNGTAAFPAFSVSRDAGATFTTITANNTPLSINTWYHIAGAYDGSRLRLYLNGIEINNTALTGSINLNNKILSIGAQETGTNNFNGTIDEVKIYNQSYEIKKAAYSYTILGRTLVDCGKFAASGQSIVKLKRFLSYDSNIAAMEAEYW